ncbi:uncharacterized protein N7479_010889 [Penicillium vulpinum]|uniref:3'-5' exonuclease domain-containing protein n=1 Tax=Penicillium vulpinum TaxID=29845 RepID=A0A1V6S0H8_9EURO|nr:uncharacterized protein N7479_010889 [Penicillium vulpinum]KAJ5952476.1 hypothetical protein N7479_010889 [Penicillium vulpinum]OQE07163.1 hypothetical protein PENVUL_c014G08427 [Penicillium vulpinum]
MPIRPSILASRKARSSIAKHSGHLDGPLRWGLSERRRGLDTCTRSVSRLRDVSLPNTSSLYILPMTSQSKRNFSNTPRKESIWDEVDEVPDQKPVQRFPDRPAGARSTIVYRDLGSLVRLRVEVKDRVSGRLRIMRQLNSLPPYEEFVDSFIELKYKYIDDLVVESAKATQECIETTQKCVTEWESRTKLIRAHIETMISEATDSVLQAEKTTQKYIAEVQRVSTSILDRIRTAVAKAKNTGRMIDHDFCCIVFARTPEWERKLEIYDQTIRGWQKAVRTAQITHLESQITIFEESMRELRDTLNNDYLRPQDTSRSRIDRVLHQSELIHTNYEELRLRSNKTQDISIRNLCSELQRYSDLRPNDKWVFGQYKEIFEQSYADIRKCAHEHRSFWLRRQMTFHPLRQSELWNLQDFMVAASSARSPKATDRRILLALALGAPKNSPASEYFNKSPLLISNKIYLQYKRLWMPKPARSPELHIYWRQLDAIAPLRMVDVMTWRLQNEIWYLHRSLRGDVGALWDWLPRENLRQALLNIPNWGIEFQKHRSDLRRMIGEYVHLNWLRLRSETLLHSAGEPVYLAGKFEVPNPMSQNIHGFKQWTYRMGQITSDAHVILTAIRQTQQEWESIHSKIESTLQQGPFANLRFLELGSSTKKPRRKKGRAESKSSISKAAFLKLSQSRLSRYTKVQQSGLPESPRPSQDIEEHRKLLAGPKRAFRMRRKRLERKAKRQHAAKLAVSQDSEEKGRLGHKLSSDPSAIKAEDRTTEGKLTSKPLPVDAPTSQDSHAIHKPSPTLWKTRPRSPDTPKFKPSLVYTPPSQITQEGSQVLPKPPPTPWKTKSRSPDTPKFKPSLVYTPPSQRTQEGSQVLPKSPPMLSDSKEVSLSREPRPDNVRPPIPRGTSNEYPGTRIHNGVRPATMLPRKPFAKPERNHGRKYSTDAILYQTKPQQSDGVSDDSLPERPLENHMSSVPDATTGDVPGSSQENLTTDEPTPSSDIGSSANPTTPQFWSHSSQQSPDGRKLIVHYCRTLQSTEEAVQHFLGSKVIGFDMEWKAQASGWDSIQSNVSVIQIANEERIAIFQVALFKPARSLEDLVSPSLKRLIESPDVMKVGVSIKADCTRLRKYLGIDARATFELSHLYKLIKYGKDNPKLVNKRGVNLSEQINEHFGLPLEKSDDVRCGDWTRALNYRQVQYAATDPYACVRLFHTMEAKRLAIQPVPPRPAYAELNQPIILPLGQAVNSEEDPLI